MSVLKLGNDSNECSSASPGSAGIKAAFFGSFAWPSLLLISSHLLPPTLHVNNQFNQLILLVHQTILIPICFLIGTLPRTEDCRNNRTALQTPHTIEPLEAASCLNSSQIASILNIMYFQLRRRKKKINELPTEADMTTLSMHRQRCCCVATRIVVFDISIK